jgi:hypothetical protein
MNLIKEEVRGRGYSRQGYYRQCLLQLIAFAERVLGTTPEYSDALRSERVKIGKGLLPALFSFKLFSVLIAQ